MPRVASHRLAWSSTQQSYQVQQTREQAPLDLVPESLAWFAWLEHISSFAFYGQCGHYTARKERRPRGASYWYAYVGVGKKLTKKYLGKTSEVTLARLEQVAQELWAPADGAGNRRQEVPALPDYASPALSPEIEGRGTAKRSRPRTEMQKPRDQLLATKLHPPRPRSRLLARTHLTFRLQQGMEHGLTLLSAPAGFGKTTLLVQWLAEISMPVAWLSLDPEDNDPVRFLTYFIASLQTLLPELGVTIFNLLEIAQATPLESAFTVLTNDLVSRQIADFALVLDDYHVITTPAIHQAITFLVEHLPPQMHLVLASRSDPPFPLARMRARGNLVELRTDTLRLNETEVRAFLRVVSGLDLPSEAIAALERRTEGWVAGLQLASLSLQGRTDSPAFLAAFTGSHRFVLDYLSEEVLARQPAAVQAFLLRTSILERLCGSLCEAVTGQAGGQAMLEALERANLFVVPLDEERQWYRYHHLFAEVLKRRLEQAEPEPLPELHRRASAWCEQQELLEEAVLHALAAGEVDHAAQIIEQATPLLNNLGHFQLYLTLLQALPDSLVRTRPLLCVYHAATLHVMHQVEEAEARLQHAQRSLSAATPPEVVGTVMGYSALIRGNLAFYCGDLAHALTLEQQALNLLPEAETAATTVLRAYATMGVLYSCLLSGEVTPTAEQQVRAVVARARASNHFIYFQGRTILLARLYRLQGRLRAAATIYEEAGQATLGDFFQVLSARAVYCFGLGELWREWNRLDEAERLLVQGLDQVREAVSTFAEEVLFGHLTLARLLQARGHYAQAVATLEAFLQVADRRRFVPQLKATAAAVRAQIELAEGHLEAARRWGAESDLSAHDAALPYPREREYLTLARLRLAQGREHPTGPFLQEAGHLLERLLVEAEAKARKSSVLEILILQALAFQAQNNLPGALTILGRALTFAESEGYIRIFVDEGKPMQVLLREARMRGLTPKYVTTLLTAFGERDQRTEGQDALIEPLTAREQEVLHLLAEGASNREIARRLVLSLGTVKKHVYNICGKLGAQSRTQALARARALHLL